MFVLCTSLRWPFATHFRWALRQSPPLHPLLTWAYLYLVAIDTLIADLSQSLPIWPKANSHRFWRVGLRWCTTYSNLLPFLMTIIKGHRMIHSLIFTVPGISWPKSIPYRSQAAHTGGILPPSVLVGQQWEEGAWWSLVSLPFTVTVTVSLTGAVTTNCLFVVNRWSPKWYAS